MDDAELNRDILAEILHHDFKTMEVSSGEITVGEEEETEQGMRFSTLEIRED